MQKVAKINWKWREVISALGGPRAVCDHIAERGIMPPEYNTVKGWFTRNSVPGAWAPLIIMIGSEECVPETKKRILPKVSNLWGGFRQ